VSSFEGARDRITDGPGLSGSPRAAYYAAQLVKLPAELLKPRTLLLEPQTEVQIEISGPWCRDELTGELTSGQDELTSDFFDRARELARECGAA
jgi:hypothetical protein